MDSKSVLTVVRIYQKVNAPHPNGICILPGLNNFTLAKTLPTWQWLKKVQCRAMGLLWSQDKAQSAATLVKIRVEGLVATEASTQLHKLCLQIKSLQPPFNTCLRKLVWLMHHLQKLWTVTWMGLKVVPTKATLLLAPNNSLQLSKLVHRSSKASNKRRCVSHKTEQAGSTTQDCSLWSVKARQLVRYQAGRYSSRI